MISDKLHPKLCCLELFGITVSVGLSCFNMSCGKALQIVPGSRVVTCISCNMTMRVDKWEVFKRVPSKICGRQPLKNLRWYGLHCVKSVQIQSFFWSVFSCIRTECFVYLRIQSDWGKIQTRKNSVLGQFSRSENHVPIWANLRTLRVKQQVSEAVIRRHQSLKTS